MSNDSRKEQLAGALRRAGILTSDDFVRVVGREPGRIERAALAIATHSRSAPNPTAQQHGRRAEHFALYTKRKFVRPDIPRSPLNMVEILSDERRAGISNERDAYQYHRDYGNAASGEGLRHARTDVKRGRMIVDTYRRKPGGTKD